jgi:TolA-binding protein
VRGRPRLATQGRGCTLYSLMLKLARFLLLSLSLTADQLVAQVAGPSPLVSDQATAQMVPGGWIVAEARANAALQAGFPATAAAGYRELLRDPALPAETKQRATLALVTAQLDARELTEAESTLQNYTGPRHAAYQLRVGLIAILSRRVAPAKAALAAGKLDELTPVDRGWWLYLQASVADAENDFARANILYEQAIGAAVSPLQRARLLLGQEQALLRRGALSEAQMANTRQTMERFPGQRTGYDAARTYAAALAEVGRAPEAQAILQRQLATLPASERNVADQIRLMLGLIAGEDSVAGRQAFKSLLRDGQRPDTQRLALQLLARGTKTPGERERLRQDMAELLQNPAQRTIHEDLTLALAQSALMDKLYPEAEQRARQLIELYPGSALKAAALGVRLTVAWDLGRYRTAADLAGQLRAIVMDARERAELGVLLAEAFFRSEDYKNAGDAYAAAMHELPAVVPAGTLIFQRVLADIRADQLDSAAKQLDEAVATTGFDAVSRWQAEWNLAKEMQVRGQVTLAQARVEKLLIGGATGVPDELRIRLMWLRAKLSFESDQFEATLRQADELLAVLAKGGQPDEALRVNVTSTAQLLKAQALLSLNRDQEGLAMLDQLRADYRATAAAQYSYLVQAIHLTQRGDMAGAQRVLLSFVDTPAYRQSEYAPLALYEAAVNLERQGLDRQLREAYEKMLERLIHDYPQSELVFYARLKQGDLLRKLNDFASARQVYEDLINNSGRHPDILLAQLALADSLFAQGANSVVNYESAAAIYERLRDLPSAPVDLRVEAGFKWGYALAKRAQPAKAQIVFWSVVDAFLLDRQAAATLGAKGRYWLSRALLELGQIHEDAGRLDEAQRAYQLIIDQKLSGAAQAQAKLARFGSGGIKP